VVLALANYASSEPHVWTGKIPEIDVKAQSYAIAAWVSSGEKLAPIQALGGRYAR
jgi:hypothetical protein